MDVPRVPQAEGARRAGGQGPGQEGQEKEGAGGEAGQGARQDGASSLLPPSFLFGSCFVSRTRSFFSCWFLFRFARPLVYFLSCLVWVRQGPGRAGPDRPRRFFVWLVACRLLRCSGLPIAVRARASSFPARPRQETTTAPPPPPAFISGVPLSLLFACFVFVSLSFRSSSRRRMGRGTSSASSSRSDRWRASAMPSADTRYIRYRLMCWVEDVASKTFSRRRCVEDVWPCSRLALVAFGWVASTAVSALFIVSRENPGRNRGGGVRILHRIRPSPGPFFKAW